MWVHTHRSLCVQGRVAVWFCLCDGRKTTVGCLGNKGFPRSTCLQLFCHPFLFISPCFPLDLSSTVSKAGALRIVRLLDFCCGMPYVTAFPLGVERISVSDCVSKHPLLGVKTGGKGEL